MEKKQREPKQQLDTPVIAPGMDIDHKLKEDATKEEIKQGDYTEVTSLSLDETDPR